MILDVIFRFLGTIINFIVSLVPNFDFLDSLLSAKNSFVSFLETFISYSLYLFNIPVLKVALGLTITYIVFVASEYFIKLFLKYTTNIL